MAKRGILSGGSDFDVGVGVRPQERDAGEPVLSIDDAADLGTAFRWEDASGCRKFGAGDFSADGAGSDFDLGIVADALDLAHLARSHEVKLPVFFREPDRRIDRNPGPTKGGKGEIALVADFGRDSHGCSLWMVRGMDELQNFMAWVRYLRVGQVWAHEGKRTYNSQRLPSFDSGL
jgi:hypothetical protein